MLKESIDILALTDKIIWYDHRKKWYKGNWLNKEIGLVGKYRDINLMVLLGWLYWNREENV